VGAGFTRLPDWEKDVSEKQKTKSEKTMNLLISNLKRLRKMNFLQRFDAKIAGKVKIF
jgi:hypothetical protein